MNAEIIKKADGFRLLKLPCSLPGFTALHFYEIVVSQFIWQDNRVKENWIILRVILHEDEKYALRTALNIFDNLIRPY